MNTLAAEENSIWRNISNILYNLLVHAIKTNLSDLIKTFYRESSTLLFF